MPEEIAKLFEDQKSQTQHTYSAHSTGRSNTQYASLQLCPIHLLIIALLLLFSVWLNRAENAFLTMSIKQLKSQLDAAQARANEWEEKWNEEKGRRDDAERASKQLRDQLQQLTATGSALGVPASSSPLLSMAIPVLLRGTSSAPLDVSLPNRRQSLSGSIASVSRLSGGGTGGPVGSSNVSSAGNSIIASPRATYAALPRPILLTGGASPQPTPLASPSATPSPTHANGLFAASASAAMMHSVAKSPTAAAAAAAARASASGAQPSPPTTPIPIAGSLPLSMQHSHPHVPPAGRLSPAQSAPVCSSPTQLSSMQHTSNSLPSSSSSINSQSPSSRSPNQRER